MAGTTVKVHYDIVPGIQLPEGTATTFVRNCHSVLCLHLKGWACNARGRCCRFDRLGHCCGGKRRCTAASTSRLISNKDMGLIDMDFDHVSSGCGGRKLSLSESGKAGIYISSCQRTTSVHILTSTISAIVIILSVFRSVLGFFIAVGKPLRTKFIAEG